MDTQSLRLHAVNIVDEEALKPDLHLHLERVLDRQQTERLEPIRLGTGRNAVVFLATNLTKLSGNATFYAVKFLRDDPDDQVAYSMALRFFAEAQSLINKSRGIASLVTFQGWGAIVRDEERRGPVNTVKEFWWKEIFDDLESASIESNDGPKFKLEANDGPEFKYIKEHYKLQGPFYCLELCQGTLEQLLESDEHWINLPIYRYAQKYKVALQRNASDKVRDDISKFCERYLRQKNSDSALAASELASMSGYDILNAFRTEDIKILDEQGRSILDPAGDGPLIHDPNVIRNHAVLQIFSQIVQSVLNLHEKGEAHRDLKPGNIFFQHSEDPLNMRVQIKLADLGYVTNAEVIKTRDSLQGGHEQALGSPFYRAPEQADLPIEVRINIGDSDNKLVKGKRSKISSIEAGDLLYVADLFTNEGSHHRAAAETEHESKENLSKDDMAEGARRFREEYLKHRYIGIRNAKIDATTGEFELELEAAIDSREKHDLQAQISKGTGIHTDVYSLGAILYDLVSGGRNPEHFYTYCLKVFTNQFGVNPELIPQSVDEVMEILVPDKSAQKLDLTNPFKLAQQRELINPFGLIQQKSKLTVAKRLQLIQLLFNIRKIKDTDTLMERILRTIYIDERDNDIEQLMQLLFTPNDINTLVEKILRSTYVELPEEEVKKLLQLLLTTNDVDTLVNRILRSTYVDLPEEEIRKKIRDYRFRTFDVVNTLLTDKRGQEIPRDIIRIIVRCMLRDKEDSFCRIDQRGESPKPVQGRPVMEDIANEVNKLLANPFGLPEHHFFPRLEDNLLFRLCALSFDLEQRSDTDSAIAPPSTHPATEPQLIASDTTSTTATPTADEAIEEPQTVDGDSMPQLDATDDQPPAPTRKRSAPHTKRDGAEDS
jgi:serine/threonine protein kinase